LRGFDCRPAKGDFGDFKSNLEDFVQIISEMIRSFSPEIFSTHLLEHFISCLDVLVVREVIGEVAQAVHCTAVKAETLTQRKHFANSVNLLH
jgi:hypothetical protein